MHSGSAGIRPGTDADTDTDTNTDTDVGTDADVGAVAAAEARRCAAMLDNDAAALDALLDHRLQFAHATGAVDNKDAYMAKMRAGRIEYLSVHWPERRITRLGETAALVTGRMLTGVRVEGTEKRLDNRVIAVWTFADGAWRMLAYQTTPLKS